MPAKLCVTVTGQTMAEIRKRRDEVTDADLVELRVDFASDPSAAAALADRRMPVVVTCRAAWEGGHFRGSEEERHRILAAAQARGAEYIDVEWKAGFDDLITARDGKGVVLSHHDFAGTPSDLGDRAVAMRATGAEIVKLAVMCHRLTDTLPLMHIAHGEARPTVIVGMGEAGVVTRVLATRYGSAWTFAGDGVAPGQLSAAQMRRELAFDRLTRESTVYGVVGRPIRHSLSPAMHNAAFRAANLDAVYLPLAAADFDDFLTFAAAIPIAGASVTAPFKLAASKAAIERDWLTGRTGAANTLKRRGDGWAARNTDVDGFLAPLENQMTVRARRATILGAGGAARAVAEALTAKGAIVSIAARNRQAAEAVAADTNALVADWPPPPGSWTLLVNATPVGTIPAIEETPMPREALTGELIYDLVYNPPETRLLRESRAAGRRTIGGLDMLVAQAELQFEWWTGQRPAEGVMREAAVRGLNP